MITELSIFDLIRVAFNTSFLCIGCPVVTITPSEGPFVVGHTLVCSSDNNLATYTFTDDDTGEVTDGSSITLSEEGSFSFTCRAVGLVRVGTPCTASATVSGTAISEKYSISFHFLCVKIHHDKRMNKKHNKNCRTRSVKMPRRIRQWRMMQLIMLVI